VNPVSFLINAAANRCGAVTPPSMLTYIVTFRCNARCIMCDSWKKEDQPELDASQIDTMLSKVPRMDIVRLSGGEPFVRGDIGMIAESVRVHQRPSLLHITSNGILSDRIISFTENRNRRMPLFLLLSVDGMKQTHNRVRGVEFAWDRVNTTLRYLAPLRKKLNLHISVNQTVVGREGIDEYFALREYLRPFGINNNLIVAYKESATYSAPQGGERSTVKDVRFQPFGDFTEKEIEYLIDQSARGLVHYSPAERIAKRYYLRGLKNRLVKNIESPNPRCVALSSHMRIYPDGTVPVCQFNSSEVGNIYTQQFKDLWYGKPAEEKRKWVRNCTGCWAECEILPSALYTGDIFRSVV